MNSIPKLRTKFTFNNEEYTFREFTFYVQLLFCANRKLRKENKNLKRNLKKEIKNREALVEKVNELKEAKEPISFWLKPFPPDFWPKEMGELKIDRYR